MCFAHTHSNQEEDLFETFVRNENKNKNNNYLRLEIWRERAFC